MQTFRGLTAFDGLEVMLPGASHAMIVFRHPNGRTSRLDRYAGAKIDGPEARTSPPGSTRTRDESLTGATCRCISAVHAHCGGGQSLRRAGDARGVIARLSMRSRSSGSFPRRPRSHRQPASLESQRPYHVDPAVPVKIILAGLAAELADNVIGGAGDPRLDGPRVPSQILDEQRRESRHVRRGHARSNEARREGRARARREVVSCHGDGALSAQSSSSSSAQTRTIERAPRVGLTT